MISGFEAIAIRAVFAVFSLYMLAILLRWFGPYLQLDVYSGRLRWISWLTDPLINVVRHFLPGMGPLDLGPLFALLFVWVVRQFSVWALILLFRG